MTELRFYVPNIEQSIVNDFEKEVEKRKAARKLTKQADKDAKMNDEEKKANEKSDAEDDEEEGESDMEEFYDDAPTPANVFNEKLQKQAGLLNAQGEIIATLNEINLLVPRGKYTMDLYGSYVRFHGRSQHFKLMYKDIDQLIKLPQVERDMTIIMIALSKHLTFGQTMHHFLLIQLETLRKARVKINMDPSEIQTKYGSNIEAEMSEETHQVLLRLFKHIGGVNKIVKPGEFSSAVDPRAQAISCSVKASQGLLYPMTNSLVFINKPIMLISHKDIKYIEFQRCGDQGTGPGKFFDI